MLSNLKTELRSALQGFAGEVGPAVNGGAAAPSLPSGRRALSSPPLLLSFNLGRQFAIGWPREPRTPSGATLLKSPSKILILRAQSSARGIFQDLIHLFKFI